MEASSCGGGLGMSQLVKQNTTPDCLINYDDEKISKIRQENCKEKANSRNKLNAVDVFKSIPASRNVFNKFTRTKLIAAKSRDNKHSINVQERPVAGQTPNLERSMCFRDMCTRAKTSSRGETIGNVSKFLEIRIPQSVVDYVKLQHILTASQNYDLNVDVFPAKRPPTSFLSHKAQVLRRRLGSEEFKRLQGNSMYIQRTDPVHVIAGIMKLHNDNRKASRTALSSTIPILQLKPSKKINAETEAEKLILDSHLLLEEYRSLFPRSEQYLSAKQNLGL